MRLFRMFAAALSAVGMLMAGAPASAAPQDAVLNKEGYWGIDVDQGSCVASMTLQGGAVFSWRAVDGRLSFGLFNRKPLARGKTARFETEAHRVDFAPSFSDEADVLYLDGQFETEAVMAFRDDRELHILVDGKPVATMALQGTGFADALDGVIACSEGKSGWWGSGVVAGGETGEAEPAPPWNAEGYWSIVAGQDETPICTAVAKVDEEYGFLLIAEGKGAMSFGVVSENPMRRGRKGRFETDAYAFDFRPEYEDDTFFYAAEDLDSQAVFALRRAREAKISVNGRTLVDMALDGTGHVAVMDDVVACARGESGWWGAGAARP